MRSGVWPRGEGGTSYRHFLSVLFLAAVENGDPHQVAQVYGAHRISSDVRIEERLLPLFWVLHRIKQEMEPGAKAHSGLQPFKGQLPAADKAAGLFREAMLKGRGYNEKEASERAASDEACGRAFGLLRDERNQAAFMQTARSFLCVKAGMDPHDIKYPAAIFEDAQLASPEWRPYLLASSVHALHGTKSSDTAVLVQVRGALK